MKDIRILNIGLVWLWVVGLCVYIGARIGAAIYVAKYGGEPGWGGLIEGLFGGLMIGLILATLFTRYFAVKIWPSEKQLSKQPDVTTSEIYTKTSLWLLGIGLLSLVMLPFVPDAVILMFLALSALVSLLGAGLTYRSARHSRAS